MTRRELLRTTIVAGSALLLRGRSGFGQVASRADSSDRKAWGIIEID